MEEKFEKVQANLILNDSQQMLNEVSISVFLSKKIQNIQLLKEDISETEALDLLIELALTILSK